MSTEGEKPKRRPKGEGILDLEGLADYWGFSDLEELKRTIRAKGVPYFSLSSKSDAENVRWDRVRFRVRDIERWEGESTNAYTERKAHAGRPARPAPGSMIRHRNR